jgi:hypothetical protein
MKTKLILCLALVLSGGSFGCSTTPLTAETKVINYSGDLTESGPEKIERSGKRLSIRSAADSWSVLIQKVKPTFAWNGCDMLWIEKDKHGQPQFILDEAYIYQPTNQSPQWVLLDANDNADFDEYYGEVMGRNLRGVAQLCPKVPVSDNDAGTIGEFAVVLSENRRLGNVYEIGWQQLMANGSCLCENNRRIYVFQDRANYWHFLGEGPGEGSERGGEQTVESKVVWENSTTNNLPFQIRFHREETTSPYNVSADDTDTNNPPDVTICYDSALVAELPAQCQSIGHNPYLLTEKDDTLEKITLRLGFFLPGWDAWSDEAKQQAEKKRILETWRAVIVRLNPKLPQHGKINEGTRVDILNPGEIINQLWEIDRQLDTLEKAAQK